MQLQSDIKIQEYSVIGNKIQTKDLQKKNLVLTLSVFQDEIEASITDTDGYKVYLSAIYASHQRKFSQNENFFLLNDFIHRFHLNTYAFRSVHLIHGSPWYVFCPAEFYIPEKKHLLLNYTHPLPSDAHILANDFQNIKILFAIPQQYYNNLLQIFPSARIIHSSTSMLHLFYYHPLLVHSKLWIHIHPNYIEIIAKNNKQFLFYNTFDTQTSLDILYYGLFCIEQLQYHPHSTDVFLTGNISVQHSIIQLLQKYVHSVQIVHHHPKLHILPIDSSLLSHHQFITLNHHLCASYPENTKAEK